MKANTKATAKKDESKKTVKKDEYKVNDVVVSKEVYDYIQSIDLNTARSKALRVLQKRQLESFLICQSKYSRQEIVSIVTSVFSLDRLTASTVNTDLSDAKSSKYSRLVHHESMKKHYATEVFDQSLNKKVFRFSEVAENH